MKFDVSIRQSATNSGLDIMVNVASMVFSNTSATVHSVIPYALLASAPDVESLVRSEKERLLAVCLADLGTV